MNRYGFHILVTGFLLIRQGKYDGPGGIRHQLADRLPGFDQFSGSRHMLLLVAFIEERCGYIRSLQPFLTIHCIGNHAYSV